jgi:hypothetical protein
MKLLQIILIVLVVITPVNQVLSKKDKPLVGKVATTMGKIGALIQAAPKHACTDPTQCWQRGTAQKPLGPIVARSAYRKYMRYINKDKLIPVTAHKRFTIGKSAAYPSSRKGMKIKIPMKYRVVAILKKNTRLVLFLYTTSSCPRKTLKKQGETACIYIVE